MTTVKEFRDLGVEFVDGDKVQWRHGNAAGVISFAWRPLDTLPDNPKFKYEQDFSQAEIKWRPSLDQSKVIKSRDELISKLEPLSGEFNHYEDDEIATQKPVFTKEFAVRGGVNVEPIYKPCIVKYDGSKYIVLQDKNGREYSRRKSKLLIRDIDTRTPKQKAVDEMFDLWCGSGRSAKDSMEAIYDAGYRKQ